MKYFFLAMIFASSVSAQINFERVESSGAGCPNGTVTAVPSPDGRTVSFLFDRFQVELPGTARKLCNIRFNTILPEGTQAHGFLVTVNTRGFTNLVSGATGLTTTTLDYVQGSSSLNRPLEIIRKSWNSNGREVNDDWTTAQTVNVPIAGPCMNRSVSKLGFSFTTVAEARSRTGAGRGTIMVDSLDSSGFIKITLKTRACRANVGPIRR